MNSNLEIKAIIFDVDWTIMPQGWPASIEVINIFKEKLQEQYILGPSTWKGADYMRWVAVWMWLNPWDFIGGENGGLFMKRTNIRPVTYESYNTAKETIWLTAFAKKIGLDPFSRTFQIWKKTVKYRPELKETMLTVFPSDTNLDQTIEWKSYFDTLIARYNWNIYTVRHPDGCIDIIPCDVDKSNSVFSVMKHYNIEASQIIVAADGKNDIWLFIPWVKSIVVANAHQEIKNLGEENKWYLAKYNDGEGFIEWLKHYDVL